MCTPVILNFFLSHLELLLVQNITRVLCCSGRVYTLVIIFCSCITLSPMHVFVQSWCWIQIVGNFMHSCLEQRSLSYATPTKNQRLHITHFQPRSNLPDKLLSLIIVIPSPFYHCSPRISHIIGMCTPRHYGSMCESSKGRDALSWECWQHDGNMLPTCQNVTDFGSTCVLMPTQK